MALTATDVTLLRESWADLAKLGIQEVGMLILCRLLETAPEVRKLFYKVLSPDMDATMENLRKEPAARQHATRIGSSLSKLVKNLESPDEFQETITYLGVSHKKIGVDPKYFEVMGSVLVYVISTALKLDVKSDIMTSWIKAYGAIKAGILAAME